MKINQILGGLMNIQTFTDAQTFVANSGVVNWDWQSDKYSNSEIVDNILPKYLYHHTNTNENFNHILKTFIKEILGQNIKNYDFEENDEC